MVYDVIVVGGGPSGATAARVASQWGASVLLLDAAVFPRVKPCGGAVSEQALSYLKTSLPPRLVHAEVFGARVHFKGEVVTARKPFRIAVLTQRSELDEYLLQLAAAAGAEVQEGARVVRVDQSHDHVEVHTATHTHVGRYVIGADGAQSIVAKTVRPRFTRAEYAVTFEMDLPSGHTDPPAFANGYIDLYFGGEYMGYSWVFPKRDRWNVGVGALASRAPKIKEAAYTFASRISGYPAESADRAENAVGWIVPAGGYRRKVGLGRVLLSGDAAGFVDPFYGEGIAYAVLSGKIAGDLAATAATARNVGSRIQAMYARECHRSHLINV